MSPYGNEKEVTEQDKKTEGEVEQDNELITTTNSFVEYHKIEKEENKYLLEMKKC